MNKLVIKKQIKYEYIGESIEKIIQNMKIGLYIWKERKKSSINIWDVCNIFVIY